MFTTDPAGGAMRWIEPETVTITREALKELLKEAVREALLEERSYQLLAVPTRPMSGAWCGVCGAFGCTQMHITCLSERR